MKTADVSYRLYHFTKGIIIVAKTIAGSILASLIILPQPRLTPTQKIRSEPTRDIASSMELVINAEMELANNVIEPYSNNTGIAEKIHPFPILDVITAIIIKSRIVFTQSIIGFPVKPS